MFIWRNCSTHTAEDHINLHVWFIHLCYVSVIIHLFVLMDYLFEHCLSQLNVSVSTETALSSSGYKKTQIKLDHYVNRAWTQSVLKISSFSIILMFSSHLPIIISLFHNMKSLSIQVCSLRLPPVFLITTSIASFPLFHSLNTQHPFLFFFVKTLFTHT